MNTPITWRRSTRCDANTCVEVAFVTAAGQATVAVRDGKDPQGPTLSFAGSTWRGFVTDLKTDSGR